MQHMQHGFVCDFWFFLSPVPVSVSSRLAVLSVAFGSSTSRPSLYTTTPVYMLKVCAVARSFLTVADLNNILATRPVLALLERCTSRLTKWRESRW